jgi:hypothetical protein
VMFFIWVRFLDENAVQVNRRLHGHFGRVML